MSSPWTPLLPMAMVGTDRHTAPVSASPAWPGEMGELVAQTVATGDNAATGLLRAAAVLASCQLAAAQGSPWHQPLPAAAEPDARPTVTTAALLAQTAWALREGPERLHHLLCADLAAAGLRLPHAVLPLALDLGRRSVALRGVLLPVLGTRGHWLAAQRDDWAYARGVVDSQADAHDPRHWSEGSLAQRVAFLQHERGTAPAAARERLQAALPDLPAKERAELAGVLAEHLGPDDEALLDRLRSDRSSEVRQMALRLLLRLPGSAHGQRAAARLAPLLRHERALLRKHWRIAAPEAAGSDWKADGLDPQRPKNESIGERAWWLYQLVRQVPLAWWTSHTGLDAEALLRWAAGTDWHEAIVRGWRDVLFHAPEQAWCEAFLAHWPKLLHDNPATVVALLPLPAREQHWLRLLDERTKRLYQLAHDVLVACPFGVVLSRPFSMALAEAVASRPFSPGLVETHQLRHLLPDLACVLHADALSVLPRLAPGVDASAAFAATFDLLDETIAVRQALHALPPRTP